MQRNKLIGKVIGGVALSLALVNLGGGQAVQANSTKSVYLLDAKCVDSGSGSLREDDDFDISIGKAVYTSLFELAPGREYASLTCRITSKNPDIQFQTLNLKFGMRDNDNSPPVTVTLYVDGQYVKSQTVQPTQQAFFSQNVLNKKNISVEAKCSSSEYCASVYFFQASLEAVPPVPQRPK